MAKSSARDKLAIVFAMDALCEKYLYDEITVKEICAASGVSQSSFYRLFEDKYQIAIWIQSVFWDMSVRQIGRTLTWEQAMNVAAAEGDVIPNLLRKSLESKEAGRLLRTYQEMFRDMLVDTLENHLHREVDMPLLFQIEFYTRAVTFLGSWWLDLGLTSRESDAYSARCVPRDLDEILRPKDSVDKVPKITVAKLLKHAVALEDSGLAAPSHP